MQRWPARVALVKCLLERHGLYLVLNSFEQRVENIGVAETNGDVVR